MNKKSLVLNIAIGLVVASVCCFLSSSGLFNRLELSSLDFSFRLMGLTRQQSKINIIEIADRDIESIGHWPWKRSWYATMTGVLEKLGAKCVYFDILFSEPSAEEEDALFESSLKSNPNIYLPFVFQSVPFNVKDTLIPIKRFSDNIKGTGAMNIYRDIDGIGRNVTLLFETSEGYKPHIAFKIALDSTGARIKEVAPRHILISGPSGDTRIPLVAKNTMMLDWFGKWEHTFRHYSFLDVLAAYKNMLDGKKPEIDLGDFKDSICLIGVTAVGLYDIIPVPMEAQYPGIGVVATAIEDILSKRFMYTPPGYVNIIIIFLLSILPAFLMLEHHPLRGNILVFVSAVVYFTACLLLFRFGIKIDMSVPLLSMLASSISVGASNFVRVFAERKKFFTMAITDGLTGLYNIKYFKMLLDTEIMFASLDPSKKFAIVMSDVDHFKKFNDTYGHQVGDLVLKEVAGILKAGLRSTDIIARYGGEEMIMLLMGNDIKGAQIIGEKIRKAMEDHVVRDEKNSYKVTSSFGIATYRPNDTVDSIIKRADEALYQAKEQGRNKVCVEAAA